MTTHHGVETLPAARSPRQVRRGRDARRAGVVVLVLFVLAGLVGLLGVRTVTVQASGGGLDVTLQHAAVTRAGLSTPYHLTVHRPGGFDGPVRVAISRDFFDRFDFQNYYPNPSSETADDEFVVYELEPPDGDVLTWSFDTKVSPNQLASWDTYRTRVLDESGAVLVEVKHPMVVMP